MLKKTGRAVLPSMLLLISVLVVLLAMVQPALAWGIYNGGSVGYDISYPQRSGPYPSVSTYVFGIVGVNGGKPFTSNSNLNLEYQWVKGHTPTPPSLYMNTAYPVGSTASYGKTGPAGNCAPNDKMCQSFNYGYNSAAYAYNNHAISATQSVTATTWWLDVETANSWSSNTSYNTAVISGTIAFFQSTAAVGVQQVGIYSTKSIWNKITGGYSFGLPIWVPGATSLDVTACGSAVKFNDGPVWLVQHWNSASSMDEDYACGGT